MQKYASAFLLPAAGMLAYFFTYSAAKFILEDVSATGALSEFLPSKIKSTIPSTSDYFQQKVIKNISAGNLLKQLY